MFDIIALVFFGYFLTWINMDTMVLNALNYTFDTEFTHVGYYMLFAGLGFLNWLFYKLQEIRHRD